MIERSRNFSKNYSNGCFHSKYLNEIFDISNRGVDYYNDHNVGFEFKESFMKKSKNIFFKVPEHQAKISDYFIFCVDTSRFYLVPSKFILMRYNFKTKMKNANIRISTINKLATRIFVNISNLKEYMDKIEV